MLGDWLNTDEVAALAGIRRGTFTAYVAREQAPQPGPGRDPDTGRRRWKREAIEEWLASRKAA